MHYEILLIHILIYILDGRFIDYGPLEHEGIWEMINIAVTWTKRELSLYLV